ncbi:serine/threonine protein kinase, partial [Streptomyces sp. WAC 01325]
VVSTGAPKVSVPDVEGLPYEKAKSDLEDKGFDVQQKTEESDRNPGVVISQDPEGGTEQEKGSTITLTVAKEKEQSTVPDVLGKTCDEAKAQMEANDLSGNCQEVDTQDPNQVGKVISTSPTAGSAVDKDSTVTIQIGKQAKQKTPVPSVVGQTVGQAKQTLAAAGFTNIQFANGSDQNDTAFVTDQDPKGNQQVDDPANTQITLTTVGFGNGGNNNGGGDNGGIFG